METIKKISEGNFSIKDNWASYSGFLIETDKQCIKLGIQDGQSCCERFGYFMSEDNLNDFEGSNLIKISITDTQLKTNDEFNQKDMYEGGVMFVNIETTNGLLQFVAYNEHNGYYGHEAVILSEQLKHSETL